MSRHPEVKWAQRQEKVFITVQLPDSKDAKVKLEPEGVFTFSASDGAGKNLYELKLELHDKVNVEESKVNVGPRSIFCVLEKAEKGWWKKLLHGDGKAPHYVKVDWDKWVDEDEDNGSGDLDLGGMDMSNLSGMGGMGGMMGGMGGMGGMDMGGMGGMMGGMGGMMGGMGGMGGMDMGGMAMGDDGPGEFDDSDDEDEVAKPEAEDIEKTGAENSAENKADISVAGTQEDKK